MANKHSRKVLPRARKNTGQSRANQVVRRYHERLQKEFVSRLKDSKIPAFQAIAGDPNLLIKFFLDYDFYTDVLGASYTLFQRIFKVAVTSVIYKDIHGVITDNPKVVFPGCWDEMSIKALIMTSFNLAAVTDEPKLGFALNANDIKKSFTLEEVKGFPENSWMFFRDYTPEKLYLFCQLVRDITMVRIANEVTNNVPAILMSVESETAEHRFGRQIGETLTDSISKLMTAEFNAKDVKAQADDFIHAIEGPLLSYVMAIMEESGFSSSIIGKTLRNSRAHVIYNTDASSGKEVQFFVHPWVRMDYFLVYDSEGKRYQARLQVCPKDLQIASVPDDDPGVQAMDVHVDTKGIKEQAISRVGKAAMKFINELVKYCLNVYLAERDTAPTEEVTDTEIPGPAGQEVAEPDAIDGDKTAAEDTADGNEASGE